MVVIIECCTTALAEESVEKGGYLEVQSDESRKNGGPKQSRLLVAAAEDYFLGDDDHLETEECNQLKSGHR